MRSRTVELAEWDRDALALQLSAMDETCRLALGFEQPDMDALLQSIAAGAPAPAVNDEGPEAPPEVATAPPATCGPSATTGCCAATRRSSRTCAG